MNYQRCMGSVNHETNPSGQVRAFRLYPRLNLYLVGIWMLNDLSEIALDYEGKQPVPGLTHFMKMHGWTGIRSFSCCRATEWSPQPQSSSLEPAETVLRV